MRNPIPHLFEGSGMTVRRFSEISGIKYGTAYDLVKGRTNIETISVDVFIRAAEAFGMTPDELLDMTDEELTDYGEVDLLVMYRGASEAQRIAILSAARGIVDGMRGMTFADVIDEALDEEAADDLREKGYMD